MNERKNHMQYFVVIGNTRVGSTWLTSSLNLLPGVFSTREVRWRMPYQEEAYRVHTYIDGSTRSIKERLDHGRHIARLKEVIATGAKLKIDPYGYAPPSAFENLGRIIEEDVHVIMLRRSYFEIFQTWKIFGIRHLPNPKYKNFRRKLRIEAGDAVTPKEAKGTDRFHRHHSAPPKLKRILLTRNQFPMSRLIASMNKPHAETKDVILYPIEEAIEDMFVLFFNDILVLSLLKGRDRAQVIDYKDIESKFFSIARKLVPTVTPEECKDVLENAPTRKIEPEGVQLVFPDDALREISDYLTSLVDEVLEGRLRVEDIVRYNEQENTLFFHTPRLVSILEKHDETRGLARPATPPQRLLQRLFTRPLRQDSRTSQNILNRMFARPLQQEYWTALRPVYFPVDLAPQTAPSLNQVGRHRTAPE